MGKHLQEDAFYGKRPFNALIINGSYATVLAPENTGGLLNIVEGYGISLTFNDNSLVIAQTEPSWETSQW